MNWVWSAKGKLVFVGLPFVNSPWSMVDSHGGFIKSLVVSFWSLALSAEALAKENIWHFGDL
jgi:hypothetical protein